MQDQDKKTSPAIDREVRASRKRVSKRRGRGNEHGQGKVVSKRERERASKARGEGEVTSKRIEQG